MNWDLWRRQIAAILRIELRKTFLSKRGWWIYILAAMPVFLTAMHALVSLNRGHWSCSIAKDSVVFAGIFQFFYLRLGIFFGCVGIFTNLFRGEVLDRTLHYYFLAPVRRDVLVAGKFLSGLITAVTFFGASVALSFYFIYLHFGAAAMREFWFNGPGLGQFGWYMLVTVLACLGYGAVFTLMGLMFHNPMVPAAAVMVWESLNVLLPAVLRKISVIHYLKSLCPVEVPMQGILVLIGVAVEPTPAYYAIPGLLAVTAAILIYASRQVRRMEVSYSGE